MASNVTKHMFENMQVKTGNSLNERKTARRVKAFAAGCFSDNDKVQLESCRRIRSLLSVDQNPPVDAVIATGVVPRLVQFLNVNDNEQLQFETAWVLTNIASGTSSHIEELIKHDVISSLIKLLSSDNPDVANQAVWTLGNISGDSVQMH